MDALTLLKNDHDEVKRLLGRLEELGGGAASERERLFGKVKSELTVHEIIEEEIFYPALKGHPKAKDIVLEGIEEHNVVDTLLGELSSLPIGDETWAPKAKVMKENVEHHIGEEEGEMFAKAREVFEKSELDELGDRMEERKRSALRDVGDEETSREWRGETRH
jgi:hemerythrin-like domain-containing protein